MAEQSLTLTVLNGELGVGDLAKADTFSFSLRNAAVDFRQAPSRVKRSLVALFSRVAKITTRAHVETAPGMVPATSVSFQLTRQGRFTCDGESMDRFSLFLDQNVVSVSMNSLELRRTLFWLVLAVGIELQTPLPDPAALEGSQDYIQSPPPPPRRSQRSNFGIPPHRLGYVNLNCTCSGYCL
ncbi:hypothetical protein DRQ53_15615 [bacterium]|nr:MAG: hypothetical protein DRQ53_15615 [bacterium]